MAYLPNRVLLVAPEGHPLAELARLVPLVQGKVASKGQAMAYVSKRGVCDLPTADPAVFEKQIRQVDPLPGAAERHAARRRTWLAPKSGNLVTPSVGGDSPRPSPLPPSPSYGSSPPTLLPHEGAGSPTRSVASLRNGGARLTRPAVHTG